MTAKPGELRVVRWVQTRGEWQFAAKVGERKGSGMEEGGEWKGRGKEEGGHWRGKKGLGLGRKEEAGDI